MLAWLMNLGFAAGGSRQPQPPATPAALPGGSSRRRGSIWEPRVELAILEHQREIALFEAQEKVLQQQLEPRRKRDKKALPLSAEQRSRVLEALQRIAALRQEKEQELEELEAIPIPPAPLEIDGRPSRLGAMRRARQEAKAAEVRRAQQVEAAIVESRRVRAGVEARRALQAAEAIADAAAAKAKALETRRREEEAIATVIWMALFDS